MYQIGKEEIDALTKVIESGQLFKINSGAQEVRHFEDELKEKIGSEYAICMTSGQAALVSALIGMGVGPGDEVIVPAYTYIATAIAVTSVGAVPVIADADETLTLDPVDFERKISPHTKAVIPVHIQGFPCDMDAILSIARKHGVLVLEDVCQADGGAYKGKRLGTFGNAGAFSFNFYKIITAGEGGALVTDDRTIFERALIYHDSSAIAYFGDQLKTISEEQFCGTEFRVSEFTGALLRTQLKRLDGLLLALRTNRDALMAKLDSRYSFLPSHDRAGDCGTTVAFFFDSAEEAVAFKTGAAEKGYSITRPIDTGKHVYTNWTPIMNRRGAFHPAMDPFRMEANRGLNMNYTPDMGARTLDTLSRTGYLSVNPFWNEEKINRIAEDLLSLK